MARSCDALKLVSWKILLAFAIILATVAISTPVGLILHQMSQSRTQAAEQSAVATALVREQAETATCRSRFNERVVSAEADVLIEQITLFVVLANHGDIPTQLLTTDVKKTALVNAKNANTAYIAHPTLPCPIQS